MRALVIEDDRTSRVFLTGLLRERGVVNAALSGEEGIELFSAAILTTEPYELVCLDVNMPGMNGHEVLRRIREIEKMRGITHPVAVLMTTGERDRVSVLSAVRHGCNGYLLKPFSMEQLQEALQKIASTRSSKR